jgi:hypothetical protein
MLFETGASLRHELSTYPHDFDWIEFMLTNPLAWRSRVTACGNMRKEVSTGRVTRDRFASVVRDA